MARDKCIQKSTSQASSVDGKLKKQKLSSLILYLISIAQICRTYNLSTKIELLYRQGKLLLHHVQFADLLEEVSIK